MTDALERDVQRAQRAERLLTDSLLVEAFAAIEAEYLKAWKGTAARDTDARERLWQAYQIIGIVQSNLKSVVNSGKLAKAELDRAVKFGERKKIFGVV